tara:strand:+ start:7 stop:135 length:129 start_codon:yes stop_codon:yes gene_type:complete
VWGVDEGFGVMTFAHFSAILKPYQYFKKIIAFELNLSFVQIK